MESVDSSAGGDNIRCTNCICNTACSTCCAKQTKPITTTSTSSSSSTTSNSTTISSSVTSSSIRAIDDKTKSKGADSDTETVAVSNSDSSISLTVIEPFYGGSHRQLIETVFDNNQALKLYTSSDKKWHWKARTSALYFSQIIPSNSTHAAPLPNILFTSSVLNLAEFKSLRPDVGNLSTILYFHENQLCYPVRKNQDRDFQYGYNEILSCLVADIILFNSRYNYESFLSAIPHFLKLIPDHRPDATDVVSKITPKCQVLPFAMKYPDNDLYRNLRSLTAPLHIVWPHRWEHDKDPERFFEAIQTLLDDGLDFRLSILGEQYDTNPEVFETWKSKLQPKILHWGYQPSKHDYYKVLATAHVVVSTAKHEFFGVAMLEAVYLGCYPLAPNALAYPEHFPEECLYNTTAQLAKRLRYFCKYPDKTKHLKVDVEKYSWQNLKPKYYEILGFPQQCR